MVSFQFCEKKYAIKYNHEKQKETFHILHIATNKQSKTNITRWWAIKIDLLDRLANEQKKVTLSLKTKYCNIKNQPQILRI